MRQTLDLKADNLLARDKRLTAKPSSWRQKKEELRGAHKVVHLNGLCKPQRNGF